MSKPKVVCFRHRRYNDVYVSNVHFSRGVLQRILNVFPAQKMIVLIESDDNIVQTLLLTGKSMGITGEASRFPMPRFSTVCSDMELQYLLDQVDVNEIEGMFAASINNGVIPNEFVHAISNLANSAVKCGMSDISLDINFPEKQMVMSFAGEKYGATTIKNIIHTIFDGFPS